MTWRIASRSDAAPPLDGPRRTNQHARPEADSSADEGGPAPVIVVMVQLVDSDGRGHAEAPTDAKQERSAPT
jgi:hypothetical protein